MSVHMRLYGCESWCLKATLYKKLRQFHARCVRTMSRTNLHHTWIHRISTENLEKELGLDSMNNYIARRQLRWLGHVSRMPFDRLPRRMLSSWLPAPRCKGATKMTYGRTMKKAMATFDINPQNWYELAADREKWHAMIKCQMTILLALSSRTTYHTRMEYIHAPPLFLCLVSFLSHFGESWNLCSLVGVGINYKLTN